MLHRVLLSYGCTWEMSWEDCRAHKNLRYSLLMSSACSMGIMKHARTIEFD